MIAYTARSAFYQKKMSNIKRLLNNFKHVTHNLKSRTQDYLIRFILTAWIMSGSCTRGFRFARGIEDPAKMTYAKLALVKRALGAKRAHAKPQSAR